MFRKCSVAHPATTTQEECELRPPPRRRTLSTRVASGGEGRGRGRRRREEEEEMTAKHIAHKTVVNKQK